MNTKRKILITVIAIPIAFFGLLAAVGISSDMQESQPVIEPEVEPVIEPEPTLTPEQQRINEIKSQALTVDYDDLARYNEDYVGKTVYFKGQVISKSLIENNYIITVPSDSSIPVPHLIVSIDATVYDGPRILMQDDVEFWGEVTGLSDNILQHPEIKALIFNNLELEK